MRVPSCCSFTSLELELQKYGYRKVWYIETECRLHGAWRIALEYAPDGDRHPCPCCALHVPCSRILSTGLTRQVLPIMEFMKSSVAWHWDKIAQSDEPVKPQRLAFDYRWERANSEPIDPVDFTWASKFA